MISLFFQETKEGYRVIDSLNEKIADISLENGNVLVEIFSKTDYKSFISKENKGDTFSISDTELNAIAYLIAKTIGETEYYAVVENNDTLQYKMIGSGHIIENMFEEIKEIFTK